MPKPTTYIDRYHANPDGSWEWVCYWCNEPLLVYPEDHVGAVTTKDGRFAGVQCRSCEIERKGQYGYHALEARNGQ